MNSWVGDGRGGAEAEGSLLELGTAAGYRADGTTDGRADGWNGCVQGQIVWLPRMGV